jgi:hypothetical protein
MFGTLKMKKVIRGIFIFNAAIQFHKIPLAICMLCCALTSPFKRGIGKQSSVAQVSKSDAEKLLGFTN